MSDLRTEHDLLAALDELGQDAPTAADVLPSTSALVSVSRWRIRRWAPVAATAVVVALAVGLAVGLSRDGSHPGPPASGPASRLVGVQWQPTSLAGSRAAHRLDLKIEPNGRFWQNLGSCSILQGQLSIAGARLKIKHVQLSYGTCPADSNPSASQQQRARALTAMLTGTVSWSIRHGQLTLRKHGIETITYSQSAH